MARAQKAKTRLTDEVRTIIFCTGAEKTSSHSRNAKAKVMRSRFRVRVMRGRFSRVVRSRVRVRVMRSRFRVIS